MPMMRSPANAWLKIGALALLAPHAIDMAVAQGQLPTAIAPQDVRWTSPPNLLFRVKLAANSRIPPHTHPDERNSTVMSGTLFVGFGDTFDEARMVAVPSGAVYVAPANVPHYLWAREGEVVYQESGIGPTATRMLPGVSQ